jgi:hypothetical protein
MVLRPSGALGKNGRVLRNMAGNSSFSCSALASVMQLQHPQTSIRCCAVEVVE